MVPRRTEWPLSRKLITGSVVVALVAGAAYSLTLISGPSFDFSTPSRRHLRQIPIERAQACGHVAVIHAQLSAFEETYQLAAFGIEKKAWDEGVRAVRNSASPPVVQPPTWPVLEAEVYGAAQWLDGALANGIPHFPPRIRAELTVVRISINEGRQQLPKVRDVPTFNALTRRFFERGQLHAGYASDLVGRQCRVRLGA